MPTFEITGPDGSKYRVTGPEGSTEQDALARVRSQMGGDLVREPSAPTTEPSARITVGGPRQEIGPGRALVEGAASGLTGNFIDELAGAQRASGVPKAMPMLPGPLAGIPAALGFGRYLGEQAAGKPGAGTQAYEQGRDERRAVQKAAQEQQPGMYMTGDIGGAIAGSIGPAGLIRGATLPMRMLQSVPINAAIGALSGAGGGETAAQRGSGAAIGGAIGGVAGPVGEAGATAIGKGIQRYLGATTQPAPGVNPAARIADADALGVPLTRGQASGNIGQQSYEEAARHYARGPLAGRALQGFDDTQRKALTEAQQGVARQLGGVAAPIEDTGAAVQGALKAKASGLRSASDAAYKSAADKDAWIDASAVEVLGKRVAERVTSKGVSLDTPGNFPGSQSAMNILKRVSGFDGAPPVKGTKQTNTIVSGPGYHIADDVEIPGRIAAQSLNGIEQARQALIATKPANAADAMVLKEIKNAFDEWLDDAVNAKLFSGDPSAVEDLKKARALWSHYKGLTKPGKSDTSQLISKIATQEKTGNEVANWLLGTAGAQQAGLASRAAALIKREIGGQSDEWLALRQAALTKVFNPPKGQGGPQALAASIDNFVDGQGAPLARVLLDAPTLDQLRKLSRVVKYTIPDPKATNPSKSGYAVAKLLGAGGLSGTGALSYYLSGGDPKYAALAALPLLKGGANLSKAFSATRAAPLFNGGPLNSAARIGVMGGISSGQ
jgi:hypothetical protein